MVNIDLKSDQLVIYGSSGEPSESSANLLTSETVEGASLALKSVNDVHGGHGLALGVLSIGYGIADHVLKEYLVGLKLQINRLSRPGPNLPKLTLSTPRVSS